MNKEQETQNTSKVDWYERYRNISCQCYGLQQEVKKLKQVITILIQDKPNVDWYEKYINVSAQCYGLQQEIKKLKQVITILIQDK